jgi:hypothetical protein
MGSPLFRSFERNMRRQFWMNILDEQAQRERRDTFRASLVADPFASIPFASAPATSHADHQSR